jgi:hypothetical protein
MRCLLPKCTSFLSFDPEISGIHWRRLNGLQPQFCRLDTGKMKIRGVMARKGDTPEYVRRMQPDTGRDRGYMGCSYY